MSDYYARIKRYTERDTSQTSVNYNQNVSKHDSKNVSISPNHSTNRDTYNRCVSYKNNVSLKVAELRRKQKVEELGYKGISPDKAKVHNRKSNMLINRLDKIIIDKEKKIEKQRMNLSIDRDNEAQKECTFKPKINTKYNNNRNSSSRKSKRTVNDLEAWHKQKMKNRVEKTLEIMKDKPTFRPKLNDKTRKIAKEIEKRGTSVEDRLLKFGEVYHRNKKEMVNKSVEGLFVPKRIKKEIKNTDLPTLKYTDPPTQKNTDTNKGSTPSNFNRENYRANRLKNANIHTKSPRKILNKYISKSVEHHKRSPKIELSEEYDLKNKISIKNLKNESEESKKMASHSSHNEYLSTSKNIQMDAKFNNNVHCKYEISKTKLSNNDTKDTLNTEFMSNEPEKMKSLGLKFIDTEKFSENFCQQPDDQAPEPANLSAFEPIKNTKEKQKNDILFATKFFDKNAKSEINKIFMNNTYLEPNDKTETTNTYKSPKIICINDQDLLGNEQESKTSKNQPKNCSENEVVESLITKSIETIKQHEDIISNTLNTNKVNSGQNLNNEEYTTKLSAFIKSQSNALICNFSKSKEILQYNKKIKTDSIKNLENDYNNLLAFDQNKSKKVSAEDQFNQQFKKKCMITDESPESMNINLKTFTNSMATSNDITMHEDTEFIDLSKMKGYFQNESKEGSKKPDNEYINLDFNESYDGQDMRELSHRNHISFCSVDKDMTTNYYCNNSSKNSKKNDLGSNKQLNQVNFYPCMEKSDKDVLYVRNPNNSEYINSNYNENMLHANYQQTDNIFKNSNCSGKNLDFTTDLLTDKSSHYLKGSTKIEEDFIKRRSKLSSRADSKSSKGSLHYPNSKIHKKRSDKFHIKNNRNGPNINLTLSIKTFSRERSISEDSRTCTGKRQGYKNSNKNSSKFDNEIPTKNIEVPLNHNLSKEESRDSLIAAMSKIELSFVNKIESSKHSQVNKTEESPRRSPLRVLNQKSQNFLGKSLATDLRNSNIQEISVNSIGDEIRKSIQLAKQTEVPSNIAQPKKKTHMAKIDSIINYRLSTKNNQNTNIAGLRSKLHQQNQEIQKKRSNGRDESLEPDNKRTVIR